MFTGNEVDYQSFASRNSHGAAVVAFVEFVELATVPVIFAAAFVAVVALTALAALSALRLLIEYGALLTSWRGTSVVRFSCPVSLTLISR